MASRSKTSTAICFLFLFSLVTMILAQIRTAQVNKGPELMEKKLIRPSQITARIQEVHRVLSPSGLKRIQGVAQAFAPQMIQSEWNEKRQIRQAERLALKQFPGLGEKNAEEAAFIIMLMALEDTDRELRLVLEESRALEDTERKLHEMMTELDRSISRELAKSKSTKNRISKKPGAESSRIAFPLPLKRMKTEVLQIEYIKAPVVPQVPKDRSDWSVLDFKSFQAEIVKALDSVSGLSEMMSLRLQMIMERRSKIIQTLSNILKKISQTSEAIIQNIK